MTTAGRARRGAGHRTARAPGAGRHLEMLVLASNYRGVALTRVPNGVRYIRGGATVPVPSPVDFSGTLDGGRHIVFDAKEGSDANRFDLHASHVRPHQVNELVTHGRRGAVAGLLILATDTDRLYWMDWMRLTGRCPPSVAWGELPDVGSCMVAIDWARVAIVAGYEAALAPAEASRVG